MASMSTLLEEIQLIGQRQSAIDISLPVVYGKMYPQCTMVEYAIIAAISQEYFIYFVG